MWRWHLSRRLRRAAALQTLFGNFFISTNEFVQWAAVAALREAGEETVHFAQVFAERRRAMIAGLRAIGLGVAFEPRGAFYILADARRYTRDSVRFAYEILEAATGVRPAPPSASTRRGNLRFSYAASMPLTRMSPPPRRFPARSRERGRLWACRRMRPLHRIIDCGLCTAYLHDDQFFPAGRCCPNRHARSFEIPAGERRRYGLGCAGGWRCSRSEFYAVK